MKELTLFNTPIRINNDGMICLTSYMANRKIVLIAMIVNFLVGREIESIWPSRFIKIQK